MFFFLMQECLVWLCIFTIQILQLEITCCCFMFIFLSNFLSEMQQQLQPFTCVPILNMGWHNQTCALEEWTQLMKEWL